MLASVVPIQLSVTMLTQGLDVQHLHLSSSAAGIVPYIPTIPREIVSVSQRPFLVLLPPALASLALSNHR